MRQSCEGIVRKAAMLLSIVKKKRIVVCGSQHNRLMQKTEGAMQEMLGE